MMGHSSGRWFSALVASLLSLATGPADAQEAAGESPESSALGFERTPPRLAFADGEVSYWRPGEADWTAARVNTPLAAGDELSTGAGANLELQVGSRAYVRAGEATQLGLSSLEPDFLQLRMTSGTVALDLRELPAGQTLEIDTPNAAFTIERKGYYRIEVEGGATKFVTRRGGRAAVSTEGGLPAPIGANEQLVVTGTDAPVLATYGTPELDDWDRWNYGRSDEQIAAASSRYVPEGVYGADDLDDHGSWRVAPSYGAVWVPRVAVGWTPYSAGTWVADPYYGWTWVDDAPWGWAPFHYGRWVYLGGAWAWAPGPRVYRPYYSPALVAFYDSPSVSVSVGFPVPFGWVALGWGEPIVPWWGGSGCRGVPHWAGWGGPHVVNNVTIKYKNTYNVNNIYNYQNAQHPDALVAVDRNRFGRGNVRESRLARVDAERMGPLNRGDLGVPSDRGRIGSRERGAERAARESAARPVVTARGPGGEGRPERTRSARDRSRGSETTAAEPTRERGRAETRVDARPQRIAPPPVRVARADASERRRPVSRAEGTRGRARDAAAPAPLTRDISPRGSRANAVPRRERTPANAPTATAASPARSSASRDARRPSTRTPRAEQAPTGAPRQSPAPRTRESRRDRAAPASPQRDRSAPRESSRSYDRGPAAAAPSRIERSPRRERAAAPGPSPAPSQGQPRSRSREGGGRREDGGGGGRWGRG